MQIMKTKPRKLREMQLPSGPVAGLFQVGATFYATQRLPDGETLVVEVRLP